MRREKAGGADRGGLLVWCLSPPSCSPQGTATPLGGGISLPITMLMIGLGQQREAGTWYSAFMGREQDELIVASPKLAPPDQVAQHLG